MFGKEQEIVETYQGSQATARKLFLKDSKRKETKGYYPISEEWELGRWGAVSFIVALLLCFIFIGFLVFLYMIIVKPPGTLTVTYSLKENEEETVDDIKTCPQCAESVKAAAKICRYCSHEFHDE